MLPVCSVGSGEPCSCSDWHGCIMRSSVSGEEGIQPYKFSGNSIEASPFQVAAQRPALSRQHGKADPFQVTAQRPALSRQQHRGQPFSGSSIEASPFQVAAQRPALSRQRHRRQPFPGSSIEASPFQLAAQRPALSSQQHRGQPFPVAHKCHPCSKQHSTASFIPGSIITPALFQVAY